MGQVQYNLFDTDTAFFYSGMSLGKKRFVSVGVNYWWAGHNANVKAAYARVAPHGQASQNEFTIQLQLFYF